MENEMDSTTAFYIAQGISVVTGVLAIVTMQLKNMKTLLFFQVVINLLASLNYLLLGGDTGAFVSLLAILQSIVMFVLNVNHKKPPLALIIAFVTGYVGISTYNIISSGELMGILPALAAFCFCMALVQQKPSIFRIWGALNPALWMPYDLFTSSYVMFFVHLGILISTIVAMIRLDGLFCRKKRN